MLGRRLFLILGCAACGWLAGCNNPVSWESDVHVPVLDDRLTWADVVPDSLYEAGSAESPAHFVLVDTLDGWDWTDWAELPDTTVVLRYDGEGALENNVPLLPGTFIPVLGDYAPFIEIDLDKPEGLELTSATLSSGQMFIEVAHSLECHLDLVYSFPGVTVNGTPVTVSMELPPASAASAGVDSVVVDLMDADFDFGQVDGFDTNALAVELAVLVGEVTSEDLAPAVTASDSVVMTLSFRSFNIDKVAGYFGQLTESGATEIALLDTVPVPNPVIDLEGTTAALHITNTIGADLRLYIDTIQFDDMLVEGDLIAGHDIQRAVWTGAGVVPGEWTLDLGSPGSDFLEGLESFPRQLNVAGRMQLNPINTSAFLMDRLDVSIPPTFWYELRVPLNLGADGVILRDSFALEGLDEFPEFDGFFHLDFTNTFPVEVSGTVDFDRLDGVQYLDTLVVPPGAAPDGEPGLATLSIPLNDEMLLPGGDVTVELLVNTMGPQPFSGYEGVRVQGRLEGTQKIDIE